ncbi:MAG TPA: MmoB/DmpM family protein [Burkholderiaceae bacterium]|nr:MmoB/DmpM family protein [Burkholderiaceae bacterium]
MVGPVLTAEPVGHAVAEVLLQENAGATLVDRGSYLRVTAPQRCVLSRRAVEARLGRPFHLPGDLERVMPAFKGHLQVSAEEASWQARR